jgi:hypothetical protein
VHDDVRAKQGIHCSGAAIITYNSIERGINGIV